MPGAGSLEAIETISELVAHPRFHLSFFCSTIPPMNHGTPFQIISLVAVLPASSVSGKTSGLPTATDVARYLAGMPVSQGSPLEPLTRDPQWVAHSNAMNSSFSKLDQRQINNIRIWRAEVLAPVIQSSRTCLYLFCVPDFLYANAFFPDASPYVLPAFDTIEC